MIGNDSIAGASVGGTIEGSVLPALLTVLINGIDLTNDLFTGASGAPIINVSDVVNGASVAEIVLVEKNAPTGSALDLKVGYEVIIEHRTRRLFGGSIHGISEDNPGSSNVIFHRLSLTDYSAELKKKLVAASFEDTGDPVTQTVGSVFTQIFNDNLSASGLLLGDVDAGPLLQKINFNYIKVINAFAELSKLTSGTFIWDVDFFKQVTFKSRTSVRAPYDIDDTQANILALDTSEDLNNYRNRQTVRGGKAVSETRTDLFEADGKDKTFTLSLPLAEKLVIKVNTVTVDPSKIGIKGIDEDTAGIEWLFKLESANVSAKTAPTLGDDIDMIFKGLFTVAVIRNDTGEQALRSTSEIGDGVYESVDVDQTLNLTTARQKGDALLDKHARVPRRISYQTDRQGDIKAGQLQTVTLTILGVNSDFLIESVETTLVADTPRYSIEANDGRELLEWLEFYRNLLRDPFLVRENEKIILVQQITENLAFTETVVVVLSDARISYTADEYTAFLIGSPIGKLIENGEADGPHILTASIV